MPQPRASAWWIAAIVLLVLAVVGGTKLPSLISQARSQQPSIITGVATHSGFVALAGYELLDGPSPEELGGVTHGIGGYVDSEHAMVQVRLTLTGNGGRISPSAFALIRPDGTVQPPDSNTLPAQPLFEGASLDASLSFVVPRASGDYTLQVRDGGQSTGLLLGNVAAPPRPQPDPGH